MKEFIKKIFKKCSLEITRYTPDPLERVISLQPEERAQGSVLLSYILKPFLLKQDEPLLNSHNNYWRTVQMAKTFLELNYAVDVIDYRNRKFIPEKRYNFFIDVRHNLERLSPFLNADCIKIMHLDTAHILFHNAAESKRLLELQQRRGVVLRPRRFELPNLGIEHADCATIGDNNFAINTFRYANKPIYRLPQPACVVPNGGENRDYQNCKINFMWFGSGGLVHKGLDLVLEAFSEMPDYHLYVCGPVAREEDFEKAYYSELYERDNIHTMGWIDVSSRKFSEITKNCIGTVYASCSEGGSNSVITCMHAGLIPIINYESGVDIHEECGILLKESSIGEIKKSVQKISALPSGELKQMSLKSFEYVRENHTREMFAEKYKETIMKIIAASKKQ